MSSPIIDIDLMVAELLKSAKPGDIVSLMKDENSVVAQIDNNQQHQNRPARAPDRAA